jgi:hypothetical protein
LETCEILIAQGYCKRLLKDYLGAIASGRAADDAIEGEFSFADGRFKVFLQKLKVKAKELIGKVLLIQGDFQRASTEYQAVITLTQDF